MIDYRCLYGIDRKESAMEEMRLGVVEARFADIIWQNAPLTTRELVKLCEVELGWKRTTTYTVLKKLCERGIFKTENGRISVLVTKEEFGAIRSESFVNEEFCGSLPSFIAAFTSRKKLNEKELAEIRRMLDEFEEERK